MKRGNIEDLIGLNGLISPIQYNEKSKDSFFGSIHEWGKDLGHELKVDKMGVARALGYTIMQVYGNLVEPNKNLSHKKQAYCVIAPLINLPQIPIFGTWMYRPGKRQIINGNRLQRVALSLIQGDILVHEYLHAYEHLLCDYLLLKGLINKQENPASIVEPPIFRFYFSPPSLAYLRKFEKRMLKKLWNQQESES